MRLLKNIGIFLGAVCLTALLVDGYLNLTRSIPTAYVETDRKVGLEFLPSKHLVFFKEGFYMGRTTEDRTLIDTLDRNADRRIALIGDSYVEAFHVFQRHHFASHLKDEVGPDKELNVVNYAMSGFNLGDMYIRYKDRIQGKAFDRIFVFLQRSDLKVEEKVFSPSLEKKEGGLRIDRSFSRTPFFQEQAEMEWVKKRFTLWELLSRCKKLHQNGRTLPILLGKFYASFQDEKGEGKDEGNAKKQEKDSSFNLPPLVRRVLVEWSSEEIVFVGLSTLPGKVKRTIRKNGGELLPLYERLKGRTDDIRSLKYWEVTDRYGHFNHRGHRLIGDLLYKFMQK